MTQSGISVLNISSDEEDEYGDSLVIAPPFQQSLPSEKRHLIPVPPSGDDDVVLIEKLPCPEDRTRERNGVVVLRRKSFQDKANDDDCCILDGNPDTVCRTNSQIGDEEDLVVTGESGPVACRDFPHARYLCAKFPFRTTSHEKFCDKCYCYLCDKPAPCLLWSQGKVGVDHCHASDQEEKWKVLKQIIRPCKPSSKVCTSQALSTMSISQPLISRSSRSLTGHFQSYSQPAQIGNAVISSNASPTTRSVTPSSVSTSITLPVLALTSVQTTSDTSPIMHSYSGSSDISTTTFTQIAANEVRTTMSNDVSTSFLAMLDLGGISSKMISNESCFLIPPSTTINGPGVYYQNNGVAANWFVSPVSTDAGRRRRRRRRRVRSHLGGAPPSSARILQSCIAPSLVQKNGPLQPNQERLDWARNSSLSTASRHSSDRLTNSSYGEPLQCSINSTRQCFDSQPMTLQDYLYGSQRDNEETSLQDNFQSNQSESCWIRTACASTQESHSDRELVQEEQARAPALLEQVGGQPDSPCVQRIVDLKTLLSHEEHGQAIRQGDCLAVVQSSNHSNGFTEALTASLGFLQSQTTPSQNVQKNTMISELVMGAEAHGQSQNSTSCLGSTDVEKLHQNDELETFLTTPCSSQELQQNTDYTEPQFSTYQGLNLPVLLADALAELDANDIWGGFDLESMGYDHCLL